MMRDPARCWQAIQSPANGPGMPRHTAVAVTSSLSRCPYCAEGSLAKVTQHAPFPFQLEACCERTCPPPAMYCHPYSIHAVLILLQQKVARPLAAQLRPCPRAGRQACAIAATLLTYLSHKSKAAAHFATYWPCWLAPGTPPKWIHVQYGKVYGCMTSEFESTVSWYASCPE
jgi:hypothetical protein